LFEHFRGAEAIVIDKEEPAGLRACDHTDCNGAACGDLSGEIDAGDGVLLPLGLIGALVVAYSYQCPVIRELRELLEKIGYHMEGVRPTEFGG
jgi:hypothetical protein